MREIKFRGKRIDNGEWIYGYYVVCGWTGKPKDYIVPEYASALYAQEIDPKTIGQFIGVYDISGRGIFESDILKYPDEYTGYEGNRAETVSVGEVGYEKEYAMFNVTNRISIETCDIWELTDDIEVIGNIHDNPELLKGDNK